MRSVTSRAIAFGCLRQAASAGAFAAKFNGEPPGSHEQGTREQVAPEPVAAHPHQQAQEVSAPNACRLTVGDTCHSNGPKTTRDKHLGAVGGGPRLHHVPWPTGRRG